MFRNDLECCIIWVLLTTFLICYLILLTSATALNGKGHMAFIFIMGCFSAVQYDYIRANVSLK